MSEKLEVVVVGDSEYRVIKTGRAQAEQVLSLTRWLSKHGLKAIREMQGDKDTLEFGNGFEFLTNFLDHLSVDAVIDLFQTLTGCTIVHPVKVWNRSITASTERWSRKLVRNSKPLPNSSVSLSPCISRIAFKPCLDSHLVRDKTCSAWARPVLITRYSLSPTTTTSSFSLI